MKNIINIFVVKNHAGGQAVTQTASTSILIGHVKQSFTIPSMHESLKLIIYFYNLPISTHAFTLDSINWTILASNIYYLHIIILLMNSNPN